MLDKAVDTDMKPEEKAAYSVRGPKRDMAEIERERERERQRDRETETETERETS